MPFSTRKHLWLSDGLKRKLLSRGHFYSGIASFGTRHGQSRIRGDDVATVLAAAVTLTCLVSFIVWRRKLTARSVAGA